MKLIIHRGAQQVGGTCIELATETTRVILDVGSPLEDPARLHTLAPNRKRTKADDLPPVPGLFEGGPQIDGVLLSHAHADHTGLLMWVKPEIPVFLSKGTSKMLMAGSIFAGQPKLGHARERILQPRKPTRIGDIAVTGFPVDHSAFDSMALLIEADGKRVLYSGDLRLHGRKPGMALELFKTSAEKPVDALLMEGTNLRAIPAWDPSGTASEVELEQALFGVIDPCCSLVLANFSPQHVDRMVSFYKASRRAGRVFVVDVYGALVLHLVSGQSRIPRPTAKNGIRVYYNQSFQKSWRRKNLKNIHNLFLADRIDLPSILADPERFVMLFRPSMLDSDFGRNLPEHTICLYSYWAGYLEKPEYRATQTALSRVKGEFLQCHTSGHIFPDDLIKFVKAIDPRQVIPVHTTMPIKFHELFPNARLLRDGEEYYLQSNTGKEIK